MLEKNENKQSFEKIFEVVQEQFGECQIVIDMLGTGPVLRQVAFFDDGFPEMKTHGHAKLPRPDYTG